MLEVIRFPCSSVETVCLLFERRKEADLTDILAKFALERGAFVAVPCSAVSFPCVGLEFILREERTWVLGKITSIATVRAEEGDRTRQLVKCK